MCLFVCAPWEHKRNNTGTWLESISNGQIWGVYRPKGAPIDHNLATKSVKCPPSPGGDNFPPPPARARGAPEVPVCS